MKSETQIRKLRDSALQKYKSEKGSFGSLMAANLIEGVLSWVLDEPSEGNHILDKMIEQEDLTE